jgi:hypothetical protein
MKKLNPRVQCVDGTSLSVQANQYAYCSPRIDGLDRWDQYSLVEVGYIDGPDDKPLTPPDDWCKYGDGGHPSDVYGYVPTGLVKEFIEAHGGEVAQIRQ